MLTKWEFCGPAFEQFIRGQLAGDSPLTLALAALPLTGCSGYTFVHEDRIIEIASELDFQRSLGHGTGEGEVRLKEFVFHYLSQADDNIAVARFGLLDSVRDAIVVNRLTVPFFWTDPPSWVGRDSNRRTAYIYVGAARRSSDAIEELFREAEEYPTTIVLTSCSERLRQVQRGQQITIRDAETLAKQAKYLLLGAFDEETKIICELPS